MPQGKTKLVNTQTGVLVIGMQPLMLEKAK